MVAIKHILITAGGTVEAIDGVRKISNASTGSLCARIYEALSDHLASGSCTHKCSEFNVHYVVSSTALRPDVKANLPISFYPVTDVSSVDSVLEKLMREYRIDYVIHGMAVSDFTKDYLIEREKLICELADTLESAMDESRHNLSGEPLKKLIRDTLEHPAQKLDASSKIKSQADLILSLKRTPKLIEKFKKLNPECFLVGFKLLKNVSEAELIRVASALSEKNGCDLVLANDMNTIKNGRHEGLLLKGNEVVGRYGTKAEIAGGIACHMLGDVSYAQTHNDGSCL